MDQNYQNYCNCMMDQNLLSVKTFVQLLITDIINENKGFTREFKRSLEILQNNVQQVKNEVVQIKNMDKNNYSQRVHLMVQLNVFVLLRTVIVANIFELLV